MRQYKHAVWLIHTPMGDALRASDEVGDDGELKEPCAFAGLSTKREIMMFAKEDLPDLSRTQSKVYNVCGFVAGGVCKLIQHAAWKTTRSALGHFSEAYTLRAGNLLFLHGKLIFKGASDRSGVYSTVGRLIATPETPITLKAYLIVISAFMCKNIYVHQCCLLEQMLSRVPWCRVVTRYDEMSNAVLFHINDWSYFAPRSEFPEMCLVSVSRRGVINARLGWHHGVEWAGNDEWLSLVDAVRDFLNSLC
jgi:hypothetical protein